MKKVLFITFIAIISQAGWMESLSQMTQNFKQQNSSEAKSAVKEALKIGVQNAIKELGEGGFLNNPSLKIPLPQNLQTVAKTLRKMGMGKYVDQFERSMNEAAQEAVPQTAPVLIDAIGKMSISDAKRLVFSKKDDAITNYFKNQVGQKLAQKIAPIIKKHMENEHVTKYYQLMMQAYNKYAQPYTDNRYAQAALGAFGISTPQKIKEQDLSSYVTNKTLQRLYMMIAKEERAIRSNPAARITPLLQKVFGGR